MTAILHAMSQLGDEFGINYGITKNLVPGGTAKITLRNGNSLQPDQSILNKTLLFKEIPIIVFEVAATQSRMDVSLKAVEYLGSRPEIKVVIVIYIRYERGKVTELIIDKWEKLKGKRKRTLNDLPGYNYLTHGPDGTGVYEWIGSLYVRKIKTIKTIKVRIFLFGCTLLKLFLF